MKRNSIILTVILSFIIFMLAYFCYTYVIENKEVNPTMSSDSTLVATFHGGVGEVIYETEIYKIDNDNDNYGFRYLNIKSSTAMWGSSERKREIINKGNFSWTDEAFEIARRNNAYSYVTVPSDDKTYSIDDFMEIFIKN